MDDRGRRADRIYLYGRDADLRPEVLREHGVEILARGGDEAFAPPEGFRYW